MFARGTRSAIIFLFCLLATISTAFGLSFPDSLHVRLWGGGQITDQRPAGLKGGESGIIDAWMTHCFSGAVFCTVYLKGAQDFPTPFIEEASLGYRHDTFSARGGMLSAHIGRSLLYKPFSVFNRFTRTSVVWDSYGFGLALDSRVAGMGLSGAATMNARENGAAHVLWTPLDNSEVVERVLVGVQTAELSTQDNSLTAGDDVVLRFTPFDAHVAVKYTAYQGYGNVTMKPGHWFEAFGEAKAAPLQGLSLCAMADYEDFNKSYSSQSILGGLDVQYMILPWLGMYGGYEYQKSGNTVSHIPQLGVAFVPVPGRTLARIGMESTITGEAYLNRIMALLWFVF